MFLLMFCSCRGLTIEDSFGPISSKDSLGILKSVMSFTGQHFTCIMSSVHSSVVVTHSVQVVQIVVGKDQIRRLLLFA